MFPWTYACLASGFLGPLASLRKRPWISQDSEGEEERNWDPVKVLLVERSDSFP